MKLDQTHIRTLSSAVLEKSPEAGRNDLAELIATAAEAREIAKSTKDLWYSRLARDAEYEASAAFRRYGFDHDRKIRDGEFDRDSDNPDVVGLKRKYGFCELHVGEHPTLESLEAAAAAQKLIKPGWKVLADSRDWMPDI